MKKNFLFIILLFASLISNAQLATQNKSGKWGYQDQQGNIIIAYQYENCYEFSEGLAPVQLNGKWGYINKTGKEMIPFIYDQAEIFKEGLASVCIKDAYGFIDTTGKIMIPLKFIDAENFNHGIAYVQISGEKADIGDRNTIEWIYIDKTGKQVN